MKLFKLLISIITSVLLFANVSLAEKLDMALAYGAGNFHSANATEFAKNVTEKSGGKLTIVTHPGGSLFKGGEIFRAVRTGQAPITPQRIICFLFFGTKFEAIDPTITALSAVNIIVIKIILVKIMSSSIKIAL